VIRKSHHSMLCLILCPLLVAQQATGNAQSPTAPDLASATNPKVATITLPRKTVVQLALQETVSSATAKKGQTVRLAVKEDVVVNGTVVILRGSPASGQVTSVRKAVHGKVDGSIRIQPISLTLPDGSSIQLREYSDDGGDGVCEGFANCLGLIVVAIPMELPMAIGQMITAPFHKQPTSTSGFDQTLAPCWTVWGSTKTKISINGPVPNLGQLSQPITEVESTCSEHAVPTPSLAPLLPPVRTLDSDT
jgi:hypothetical protein